MSSSLIYLTPYDFSVDKNVLRHNITGSSVVLFYAPSCEHSMNVLPHFKKLPQSVMKTFGCHFAVFNLGCYKELITKSQKTSTPMTYAPYILMYHDGIPYAEVTSNPNCQDMTEFINETLKSSVRKMKMHREYCTGQPLCGDDSICYLVVDENSRVVSNGN